MTAFDYQSVDWPTLFREIHNSPGQKIAPRAREIGMSRPMLSKHYHRWLQDASYNPRDLTWGGNNRSFKVDQEQTMVATMIDEIGSQGMALPEWRIRDWFKAEWDRLHPRETRSTHFNASKGWMYRLKKRNRLSARRSQKSRKRIPNQAELESFVVTMKEVREMFPPDKIFNSDETPVHVSPSSMNTTHRIGQDTPHVHRQPGEKDMITALATVSADGRKWPLTVVAKGTTPQCVRNLDMPDGIYRQMSPSGRTNTEICVDHIERISDFANNEPCCLLWDAYGAHWTPEVHDKAFAKKVRLEKIPPNATSELQPLDTTVFPVVASQHMATLRHKDTWSSSVIEAKQVAIRSYNSAWNEIPNSLVKKSFSKI